MNSEIFNNRLFYYTLIHDLLDKKINPWDFREKFWEQRNNDLDKNNESGYSDNYIIKTEILKGPEKYFQEDYFDRLLGNAWTKNCLEILKEYEQAANDLDIKSEWFFMGIWDLVDEYVREYYPSDREEFDPNEDTDEETLLKVVQASYDVLTRNKDRWMNIEK